MSQAEEVLLERFADRLIELDTAKGQLEALRAYRDLMDAWSRTGVRILCAEVRNALDEILEEAKGED